jgi:hypothetical protein
MAELEPSLQNRIVRTLRIHYGFEPVSGMCAKQLVEVFSEQLTPMLQELQKRRWERDQAIMDLHRALQRADALEARLRALEGR